MTDTSGNSWHSQPLLLLQRAVHRPMRRFVAELLVQAGYLCAQNIEMDETTDLEEALQGRSLVLVNADELSDQQQLALAEWIKGGGRAVLLGPPDAFVEHLGQWRKPIHAIYRQTPPCYARFDAHEACGALAGHVVQIATPTALRMLEGAQSVVSLGMRRDSFSTWPGVVECDVGKGRVAIYWFDMGSSLALLRQGDPRLATTGSHGQPDEPAAYKAGFLTHGVVDPHLSDVPQADLWVDLLVSQMRRLSDDVLPLPRIWQFPNDLSAITLLDGDSDVYNWDNYGHLAEPAARAGIPYTLNVMGKHLIDFDLDSARHWIARGHDFQLHYWPDTATPTTLQMRQAIDQQQRLFHQALGWPAIGGRAHTCIWPGYTDTADALADAGHRIETNYCPLYGGAGYRGSARPARMITPAGRLIPLNQQPTIFMDDMVTHEKGMVEASTPDQAHAWITRTYAASVEHYHGVICTCLHPKSAEVGSLPQQVQRAILEAVISATSKPGVGALSYCMWVDFLEARRSVRMSWRNGWHVHADQPIAGCTFHLPNNNNNNNNKDSVTRQRLSWRTKIVDLARGQHALADLV